MYTLEKNGFAHYQVSIPCSENDFALLHKEFSTLERDIYAPKEVNRYRRYANAIILPWKNNELSWLPTKKEGGKELSGYDQGSNNPEHNNIRYFNAISTELKNSDFLKNLVIDDFEKTFGMNTHYLPIYAGIHLVKVCCLDNKFPGFSSPDCFYQKRNLYFSSYFN